MNYAGVTCNNNGALGSLRFYLTASVHCNEIRASPYMQAKLEEGVLPQRQCSLSQHLVWKKLPAILTHRAPRSVAGSFLLALKAQGSFGKSLAAFSGAVLLHDHDLLSAAARQRRFCAFEMFRGT